MRPEEFWSAPAGSAPWKSKTIEEVPDYDSFSIHLYWDARLHGWFRLQFEPDFAPISSSQTKGRQRDEVL